MPAIKPTSLNRVQIAQTDTAQEVAQKLQNASVGKALQRDEIKIVQDIFAKFGTSPEVKAALTRLLGGLNPGEENKLGQQTLAGIRGGQAPVVPGAKTLPVALSGIPGVGDANDVLNPGKVKDYAINRNGLSPEQAREYVKKPQDVFRGVVEIDPKNMLPSPLGDVLGGKISIETHTNQYKKADGTFGNQILLNSRDNTELIAALKTLRDDGILIKDMTHREQGVWVAGPANDKLGKAFEGDKGVKGTTHRGALDVGVDKNGKEVVVFTDWPVGYGHHLNGDYTPLVSRWSIDDIEFEGTPPTKEEKQAYYDGIRAYETIYAMAVPFTSDDSRPGFGDYHFSPMEDLNAKDMGDRSALAAKVLQGDANAAKEMEAKTFYCAEGVTTSIHTGIVVPPNQESVRRGLMKPEALAHFKAIEAEMKRATDNYTKPAELGWEAVAAKKLITPEHLDSLKEQNMQHRYFKLPKDDLPPLKDKGAKGLTSEGLAHQPQHIGGLVQGMMASAFPRERLAEGLGKRFVERAAQDPKVAVMVAAMFVQDKVKASLPQGTPDAQVQQAVMQAAQQFAQSTPMPQMAQMFGWAVGAQFQAQMIKSPQMQETMKHAMGHHLMDAASKKAVEDLIEEYAKVVGNPTLDRAALDKAVRDLNEKAANTPVNFPSLNWQGLIRHVPPQGSRDVLLGVDGHSFAGLRPAFDIIDKTMGA